MPRHTQKQTKKFITKHLKDTIDRRKQHAKIKQKRQMQDKRKARKAADNARASDDEPSEGEQEDDSNANAHGISLKRAKGAAMPDLKDMSMDDFFQGGFEIAQSSTFGKGKKNAGTSKADSKLGKRKRLAQNATEDGDSNDETSSGIEPGFDDDDDDNDDSAVVASDGASDVRSTSDTDQVAAHKNELSALAEKDAEFYEYLKREDPDLLDFAVGGDTLILSDDEDEDGRSAKRKKVGSDDQQASTSVNVTVEMVRKWANAMAEQHSQAAMREMILAFRAAAHTNDEDNSTFKYAITDGSTYHEVLINALKGVPGVLAHHLPVKETANGKIKFPTDAKKYRSFSPMLNSHAISVTHLLENLADTKAVNMVLVHLEPMLPYFLSFKKSLKNLVKAVIGIWSDASSSEATRVNAFLLFKRLAIIGDASLREAVLKSAYQGLVRSARNTTVHTLPGINLMKNSAAELWGLDPGLGYTTGFTYIRQLAIHLRTSITQPSKENYKAIYNWQYVHSLDFWSRVLSQNCSPAEIATLKKPTDSPLHPLIYPLVQVTLGALRLVPSPIYFPLRFQLTRSLLRISRTTETYIPLAPSLVEVLQSPEMKRPAKSSTLKPLDFDVTVRAPESYLRTRVYQDGVSEQLSELLAEFFGVWAKNIAFPELVIPPLTVIKKWLREVSPHGSKGRGSGMGRGSHDGNKGSGNKNGKANAHFSLLAQKLQANATFVEQHRRKVDFAISDRKGVDAFLRDIDFDNTPLGAYIMTIRKQKEERDEMLRQSRIEDERRRKEEVDNNNDFDDSSSEEEQFDDDAGPDDLDYLDSNGEEMEENEFEGLEKEDEIETE